MAVIIYESSSASLVYDKPGRTIELKWKQGAYSDEYRELFSNLVEFARKNDVIYFISDLRSEGHVPVEDLQWLEVEVLEKVQELGIQRVALITEDTVFSTVYAETIKRKLNDKPTEVQIFDAPEPAYAWIHNDS